MLLTKHHQTNATNTYSKRCIDYNLNPFKMPRKTLSLNDEFDDGTISGLWLPVVSSDDSASVSESDGTLTVADDRKGRTGVNGNLYLAPDFELRATIELTAGSGDDGAVIGGRGDQCLDRVPDDSRLYVAVHADGPVRLHVEELGDIQSTTLSGTQGTADTKFSVALRYQASDDKVHAEVEGNGERSAGALNASGGCWVSLAPWAVSVGGTFDVHEVEARGPTGFSESLEISDYDRIVHKRLVTDKPTDPHFPKEPGEVQHGETIYLAIAGFNGYEGAEGGNEFVSQDVTEKDVTLWRGTDPLGEFEQISVVTDQSFDGEFDLTRKAGFQHAPGIGIIDDELWVLYNQRVADEIHAKHASVEDIPDRPPEWTHDVLTGDASDVKSIIRHGGRVHLVFSNGEFTKADLISGEDMYSLDDRTKLVSVEDGYPGGISDSIVAPHVLPAPDGGWYLLLERRLGDGYTDYGGEVVLYSDTLLERYHPRGATSESTQDGRPGSHPDVWMAPGRVARSVLPDRTDGYIAKRAGHAVFCFEAGQRSLATRDGKHFGYFEGETDAGFHVMGFTS